MWILENMIQWTLMDKECLYHYFQPNVSTITILKVPDIHLSVRINIFI